MKKLLTIMTASFVLMTCFSACGEKAEDSSSDVNIVNEVSQDNEPVEEVTEKTTLEFTPDEVREEDFVGKWECEKMFKDGEFYDNINDIPINIMVQFSINDDHTVRACPGIEGNEDNGTEFEWTFRENKLIPIINGEEANVYYILQDGQLVANIGENNSIYFCSRVDELIYVSQEELYKLMYGEDAEIPTTETAEETMEETSEDIAEESSAEITE